jgi:serine-type D-Ala-D-Ala carboxypeptidase (penicillin-binding protein 5/6)
VRPRALRALAAAFALAGLAGPTQAPASPPDIAAPQAYVVQPQTGDVLFRRQPERERPVASATKLMTALVVLERVSLEDVFTAVPYSPAAPESRINLRAGERMKVRDLLVALLLESANDAAVTLAAGTSGSREQFVREMNARARSLGLRHTSFANPIGLDAPGNYSSAADLVKLTLRLRRNAFFRRTVARRAARLRSGSRPRVVENRNDLVGNARWVDGVKTGHTEQAGYVLVGSATRGGVSAVTVVLGEPGEGARNADTLALLQWALDQYRLAAVVRPDRVLARARVKYRSEDRIELVPARRLARVLRRGERPAVSVRAPEELQGPLPQGARVGSATVRVRGRVVATVPLVTAQPVPEVGLVERAVDQLAKPGTLAVVLVLAAAGVLLALVGARRREGQRA